MEKTATYTVMTPPPLPPYKQLVVWGGVCVSVVALVIACVTAAVVNEQARRVNMLEGRLMEIEIQFKDLLELTLANNYDYDLDFNDDYQYQDDEQDGEEGITVRRVVRKRRQVNSVENDLPDPPNVPIYERPYSSNLKSQAAPRGLTIYDSLLNNADQEDQSASQVTPETTESPIKPHHRDGLLDPSGSVVWPFRQVSNLWVPKRTRSRLPNPSGPATLSSRSGGVRHIDSTNGEENELAENIFPSTPSSYRRSRLTQRRSRTKSLHGSRRGTKRQQKQHNRSNKSPGSVVFRTSFVKATSPQDTFSSPNSVVPRAPASLQMPDNLQEAPKVVEQNPGTTSTIAFARQPTSSFYGKKRRNSKNKQHRRRRRTHPLITLAHFGASSRNTTNQGIQSTGEHMEWKPAAWMDKLGLNRKYTLDQGAVKVKEAGLYYLYAQVLYKSGRSGGGFQILVDDIPILECQLAALRPAPTCLTGGLSYLPRNAAIRVHDLHDNLETVKRHQNTFFGLVKLMDTRYTPEEMLLA